MTYPDEHEAQVERAIADLARAGVEPPPSIVLLNAAAHRDLAERGYPEPIFAREAFREPDRPPGRVASLLARLRVVRWLLGA